MTGRERMTQAARGGAVDRRPTVSAFGAGAADAIAVPPSELARTIEAHPDSAALATVLSPLGRALAAGRDIVAELHADVDKGGSELATLVAETREEMHAALEQGADGVFYVLDGAHPGVTTPMEYGGHFLEVDRSLLCDVDGARFNVVYVRAEREPYIDFVSDLPAHAFAWDPRAGVPLADVRSVRPGALASSDADADIALIVNVGAGV